MAPAFVRTASAYTELEFDAPPVALTPDPGAAADKVRLLELADGSLVAVWHAAAGPADGAWYLDGTLQAPKDIFYSISSDSGQTWSAPVNLSQTANLTDPAVLYDRIGDGSGLAPFYGDSGKPDVFASGNRIGIAWNDTYCGPGRHGPSLYDAPLGQIEIPFRCLYVARLALVAGVLTTIRIDQVTDAARGADNETIRASGAGFAVVWQEDPAGLQLGEGAGEGDGASGARVTPGTDIWYTWISASAFDNAGSAWAAPVPISDNYDYANDLVLDGGGSRPIVALTGSPTTALVVYEEAKNSGPDDPGKYAMFHAFRFSAPPVSQPGTILSDPGENARRVRVVAQGTPGGAFGTRLVLLWRQGTGIQGAPADILVRIGRVAAGTDLTAVPDAGFRPEDLWPAVAAGDPLASSPALNLSSSMLDDPTSLFPAQDAKAHRAMLDGDTIFAAYTQNDDVNDPTQRYRYWVIRSFDGGSTWMPATDVSSASAAEADAIEPRLMRTPATVSSGDPDDIRDPDTYVLAWGTSQVPAGGTEAVATDVFVTRTTDLGLSYERPRRLREAGTAISPTANDEAVQLRISPSGRKVAAVWIRRDGDESAAMFVSATEVVRTADLSVTVTPQSLEADLGTDSTLDFTVTNQGPDTATAVRLDITPDAGLTVQNLETPVGQCAGAPIVCELGALSSGSSVPITVTLRGATPGSLAVEAQVSAPEVELTPSDNVANARIDVVDAADLALGLTVGRSTRFLGSELGVSVSVVNAGPQPAAMLRVQIVAPSHFELLAAPPGCSPQSGQLVCAVASLGVGERWLGDLVFRPARVGWALLSVQVESAQTDRVPDNNSVEESILIKTPRSRAGGCTAAGGGFDPTLAGLLLLAAGMLARRRRAEAAGG